MMQNRLFCGWRVTYYVYLFVSGTPANTWVLPANPLVSGNCCWWLVTNKTETLVLCWESMCDLLACLRSVKILNSNLLCLKSSCYFLCGLPLWAHPRLVTQLDTGQIECILSDVWLSKLKLSVSYGINRGQCSGSQLFLPSSWIVTLLFVAWLLVSCWCGTVTW